MARQRRCWRVRDIFANGLTEHRRTFVGLNSSQFSALGDAQISNIQVDWWGIVLAWLSERHSHVWAGTTVATSGLLTDYSEAILLGCVDLHSKEHATCAPIRPERVS